MKMDPLLRGPRTDDKSVSGVCVPLTSAKSIASTVMGGTGDGLQPRQRSCWSAAALRASANLHLTSSGALVRVDDPAELEAVTLQRMQTAAGVESAASGTVLALADLSISRLI